VGDEAACQEGGQLQAGPLGLGQDAVVAGGGPVGKVADDAEKVADGAAAGAEDRRHRQQLSPWKNGRGEGRGKEGKDRQGVGGYTGQEGLLAAPTGVVVSPPMLPPRRPLFWLQRLSSLPHNG
jgi:hypothetical protein